MRYRVTALVDAAQVVTVPVDAGDAEGARALAQRQGYAVLSVSRALALNSFRPVARRFPLQLLTQELRLMLEAGLTLPEAVQALVEKETREEIRQVLEGVCDAVLSGASLSAALSRRPDAFPVLLIATVRASEKTGDLPEALGRYLAYHQQIDAIRKKVISASVYPALLLAAGALAAFFLLGYVVPRFSAVYEDIGHELPWLSTLLLAWGRLLHANAFAVGAAALAIAAAAGYALSLSRVRRALLGLLWRFPRLGERLRVYDLGRLYRTLGMLLRSGIPVVAAIRGASGLASPELQGKLAAAVGDIEQGQSISAAMTRHGLTTPVALRMLRVGERTGRMSELMERIAAYYEDDMARWTEWFTRLFEPVLMLLIGAVIGLIVLLMYLPIFDLVGGLQ
jgi:general secretion pathway protein F